jgi:ferredoxin
MRAFVDETTCIGCGLCADTCPEVYEIRDDGVSHVLLDPVPPELQECVRDTVDSCPVTAISVEG